MDLLNLGSQSRKTGIRPKKNLRKDKFNMEDIDEFFSEDDSDSGVNTRQPVSTKSRSNIVSNTKSDKGLRPGNGSTASSGSHGRSRSHEDDAIIARKINFTDAETDKFDLSPISISKNKRLTSRSPLSNEENREKPPGEEEEEEEEEKDNNDENNDITPQLPALFINEDVDEDINHFDDLNVDMSNPLPQFEQNSLPSNSNQGSDVESIDEPQQDQLKSPGGVKKRKASSLTKNMALGLGSKSKPRTNTLGNKSPIEQMSRSREISVKPSPLPSPPPDGLRRSKRTRIQPLAFWRGERIIYSRADEENQDPDSTLSNDIRKIPLQEIKEIIHVPAPSSQSSLKRKGRRLKSKSKSNSRSNSHSRSGSANIKDSGSKLNLSGAVQKSDNENAIEDNDDYDYESDPEVEGSEWFKDKQLKLDVFENHDSESLVKQDIAFTPDVKKLLTDPPKSKDSEIDNYKIAKLFNDSNTERIAVAIMEFPHEGFKSSKSSGNCVYMFHVNKGLLEITLSNHSFVVTRGCSFQVPSGNTYGINNIGNGPARVFCVQIMDDI